MNVVLPFSPSPQKGKLRLETPNNELNRSLLRYTLLERVHRIRAIRASFGLLEEAFGICTELDG